MNFISVKLKGGIGNYMFQIATAFSKSLDLNFEFFLNEKLLHIGHNHPNHYKNNILRNIKFLEKSTNNIYKEPFFHFQKIPNFEEPTILEGYFQSEKYFKENKKKVIELFGCPKEIRMNLQKKYPLIDSEETCSLHIRRGDYLKLSDYHPQQSENYYEDALETVGKIKTLFIFSDDINWCKNNLKFNKPLVFCENNNDYEDLYLMSMCKNNIITNSSFSWWGAWLNENENKKVVAPKLWFGKKNSHLITKDLYCENWIIL